MVLVHEVVVIESVDRGEAVFEIFVQVDKFTVVAFIVLDVDLPDPFQHLDLVRRVDIRFQIGCFHFLRVVPEIADHLVEQDYPAL